MSMVTDIWIQWMILFYFGHGNGITVLHAPNNTAVFVGDEVILQCVFDKSKNILRWAECITNPDCVDFTWDNQLRAPGEGAMYNHYLRFRMVNPESSVGKEHNLRLRAASFEDAGKYRCANYSHIPSRYAELVVLEPVTCSTNISGQVEVLDYMNVSCQIKYRGRWAPQLRLVHSSGSSKMHRQDQGNGMLHYNFLIRISKQHTQQPHVELYFDSPSIEDLNAATNPPRLTGNDTKPLPPITVVYAPENIKISAIPLMANSTETDLEDAEIWLCTSDGQPSPKVTWRVQNYTYPGPYLNLSVVRADVKTSMMSHQKTESVHVICKACNVFLKEPHCENTPLTLHVKDATAEGSANKGLVVALTLIGVIIVGAVIAGLLYKFVFQKRRRRKKTTNLQGTLDERKILVNTGSGGNLGDEIPMKTTCGESSPRTVTVTGEHEIQVNNEQSQGERESASEELEELVQSTQKVHNPDLNQKPDLKEEHQDPEQENKQNDEETIEAPAKEQEVKAGDDGTWPWEDGKQLEKDKSTTAKAETYTKPDTEQHFRHCEDIVEKTVKTDPQKGHLHEKPWREQLHGWDIEDKDDLFTELTTYNPKGAKKVNIQIMGALSPGKSSQHVNVLMVGPVSAGKSSFINTLQSTLKNKIVCTKAFVGTAAQSMTTVYRRYNLNYTKKKKVPTATLR